jgi:hypothetical protein
VNAAANLLAQAHRAWELQYSDPGYAHELARQVVATSAPADAAHAWGLLCVGYYRIRYSHDTAAEALAAAREEARQLSLGRVFHLAGNGLAWLLACAGEGEAAKSLFRASLQDGDSGLLARDRIHAWNGLAGVHDRAGETLACAQALLEALVIARRERCLADQAPLSDNLAKQWLAVGEFAAAAALAEQALVIARDMAHPRLTRALHARLASAAHGQGDTKKAEAAVDAALAGETSSATTLDAATYVELALVLIGLGRYPEARLCLEATLGAAEYTALLESRVNFAFAQLARSEGRLQEAWEILVHSPPEASADPGATVAYWHELAQIAAQIGEAECLARAREGLAQAQKERVRLAERLRQLEADAALRMWRGE